MASPQFPSTHWSVVLQAGQDASEDSRRAVASLCQTYWYPLYAFARRRGCDRELARDETQSFFTRLLELEFKLGADPERGRFRSFLLTAFKRFMADQYERRQAYKRGGGRLQISLDFSSAEQRYLSEPTDNWTAERIYQRRWAITLLDRVLTQLRDYYRQLGKEDLFEVGRSYLTEARPSASHREMAEQLDMSETAVRVAVHRMRERYRELLKQEVARTVELPAQVDAELACLRAAIRGDIET